MGQFVTSVVGETLRMFSSIRRLSGPSERQLLGRCLTTSTTSKTAETIQNSDGLKDFEEIPSPPALPLLGHMLDLVKQGSRLDKYNNELQAKYGEPETTASSVGDQQ